MLKLNPPPPTQPLNQVIEALTFQQPPDGVEKDMDIDNDNQEKEEEEEEKKNISIANTVQGFISKSLVARHTPGSGLNQGTLV